MVAPVDLQGISVNQVAQTCPDVPSKDLPAGDPVTWSSFEGWNIRMAIPAYRFFIYLLFIY